MISPAPGCISRKFRSAVGLDTPSHSVTLSRWRSANEYTVGSVLSKYPEATKTPQMCNLHLTPPPTTLPALSNRRHSTSPRPESHTKCTQHMYATYVGAGL